MLHCLQFTVHGYLQSAWCVVSGSEWILGRVTHLHLPLFDVELFRMRSVALGPLISHPPAPPHTAEPCCVLDGATYIDRLCFMFRVYGTLFTLHGLGQLQGVGFGLRMTCIWRSLTSSSSACAAFPLVRWSRRLEGCGVWCVVCGVWCVVCGMVCGIGCVVLGAGCRV